MQFFSVQSKIHTYPWRAIALIALVLLILIGCFLAQRYVRVTFRDLSFDWLLEIRRSSFVILSLILFSPIVFFLKTKFPFHKRRLTRNFAWHFTFGILFALAHLVFVSTVNAGLSVSISSKVFLNFFHLEVLCYWLILAVAHVSFEDASPQAGSIPKKKTLSVLKNGILAEVPFEQIQKIQAYDHYCQIFTVSDQYIIRSSISRMNEVLSDEGFVRVHRSWIVNTMMIERISRGPTGLCVQLKNGNRINIGRTYLRPVKSLLRSLAT